MRGTAAHDDAGDSCALCGADDCSNISRVLQILKYHQKRCLSVVHHLLFGVMRHADHT